MSSRLLCIAVLLWHWHDVREGWQRGHLLYEVGRVSRWFETHLIPRGAWKWEPR